MAEGPKRAQGGRSTLGTPLRMVLRRVEGLDEVWAQVSMSERVQTRRTSVPLSTSVLGLGLHPTAIVLTGSSCALPRPKASAPDPLRCLTLPPSSPRGWSSLSLYHVGDRPRGYPRRSGSCRSLTGQTTSSRVYRAAAGLLTSLEIRALDLSTLGRSWVGTREGRACARAGVVVVRVRCEPILPEIWKAMIRAGRDGGCGMMRPRSHQSVARQEQVDGRRADEVVDSETKLTPLDRPARSAVSDEGYHL